MMIIMKVVTLIRVKMMKVVTLIRVMMTKFLHGDVSQGVRRWWVAVLLPRNIIIVITDQQSS